MWRELSDSEYQQISNEADKNRKIVGIFISLAELLFLIVLTVRIVQSFSDGASLGSNLQGIVIVAIVVLALQIVRVKLFNVKKEEAYEAYDAVVSDAAEYVNYASHSYGSREAVNYKVMIEGQEVVITVNGTVAQHKAGGQVVVVREKAMKDNTATYRLI